MLERFQARDGRALRRVPQVERQEVSLGRMDEFLSAEQASALLARARAELAEPEELLYQAIAPPMPGQPGALALVLTRQRVLWVSEQPQSCRSIGLAAISSLELESALPGAHLAVSVPGPGALDVLVARFPYPLAEPFVELYHAARRLLTSAHQLGSHEA